MIIQIKDDNTSKTLSPLSGEMIPDTGKLPKIRLILHPHLHRLYCWTMRNVSVRLFTYKPIKNSIHSRNN